MTTVATIALIILVAIGALFWFNSPDTPPAKHNGNLEVSLITTEDTELTTDSDNTTPGSVPRTTIPTASSGATLDLSGQGLTKLPMETFSRTGIEVLDVSNNNLMNALPAEIRQLSSLRVLDMSNNKLTGIPAEVGQLRNLEVLNVSGNPITGLPYELGNLKNLKVLDLSSTNYAAQDLEIIKQGLSAEVEIRL